MKSFHWVADNSGCGWYRGHLVTEALSELGHDSTSSTIFDDRFDLPDLSPIVGQRICLPGSAMRWAHYAASDRRLVFDMDDDYWCFDDTNPAREFYDEHMLARMAAAIHVADVVTCATPALAERARQFTDGPVWVVPNGLPERVLHWSTSALSKLHGKPLPGGGTPRVTFGMVGTSSTMWDLATIAPIVRRFLHKVKKAELHIIGLSRRDVDRIGLKHPKVRTTSWVETGGPYLRAIDFDVWLAPYRDTPYNRAKAPTKALEASFLGIPIIASPIAPYAHHISTQSSGYLANGPEDWADAMTALMAPEERAELGASARQRARHLTVEEVARVYWADALWGDIHDRW